jgi:hypothetical protein
MPAEVKCRAREKSGERPDRQLPCSSDYTLAHSKAGAHEQYSSAHLPIDGQATAVTLMTRQSADGQWARTAIFTLS